MKKCHSCGAKLPDEANFCLECFNLLDEKIQRTNKGFKNKDYLDINFENLLSE